MIRGQHIGIDLGTANTIVCVADKGIIIREPSVVAQDITTGRVVAFGHEAALMIGKTPQHIRTVRPMREGVIADYDLAIAHLHDLMKRTISGIFAHPRVMVCVPTSITAVERRAIIDAVKDAGARDVLLIEEAFAAALGAGLPVYEPTGSFIVDIGGGTTDIATIALGGLVNSRTIKVAGNHFDEAIVQYIKRTYHIAIGEMTAEQIKIGVGTAMASRADSYEAMAIRGRSLTTGLPQTLDVSAKDIVVAIDEVVQEIILAIKELLELAPPEIAADVANQGIVLTGGGALLRDLPERIAEETAVPVIVAERPLDCVAVGTNKALSLLPTNKWFVKANDR